MEDLILLQQFFLKNTRIKTLMIYNLDTVT